MENILGQMVKAVNIKEIGSMESKKVKENIY